MDLNRFKKIIKNIDAIIQEHSGFKYGYLDDNFLIKEMLKKIYNIYITTKESYVLQYHDFKFDENEDDLTDEDVVSEKFLKKLFTTVKYTKKEQKLIDDSNTEFMLKFVKELHNKLQEVVNTHIKSNKEFYLLKHGHMVDNDVIELLQKMQVNIKVLYLKSFWEETKPGQWKTGYKKSDAQKCDYTVLYIHRDIEGKYSKPDPPDVIKTYDESSDEDEFEEVEVSKKKNKDVEAVAEKVKELKDKKKTPGKRKVVRKTIKRLVKRS
jgi:hypothetical protein